MATADRSTDWPGRGLTAGGILEPVTTVSAREGEVLDLVGAGLTNAQIGARLFISVRTVESHVSSPLRKLDVTDRHQLAARASTAGAAGHDRLARAPEAFTSFVGRRDDLSGVAAALDAAAVTSRQLLQRCPELAILATSREQLGVPGEHVVPVSPLAVDGDDARAVALFVTRPGCTTMPIACAPRLRASRRSTRDSRRP